MVTLYGKGAVMVGPYVAHNGVLIVPEHLVPAARRLGFSRAHPPLEYPNMMYPDPMREKYPALAAGLVALALAGARDIAGHVRLFILQREALLTEWVKRRYHEDDLELKLYEGCAICGGSGAHVVSYLNGSQRDAEVATLGAIFECTSCPGLVYERGTRYVKESVFAQQFIGRVPALPSGAGKSMPYLPYGPNYSP